MMVFVEVVFWLSFLCLFYNYIGFPFIMRLLSIGKKQNENCFNEGVDLPMVSVLLAAYNEEEVIEEKIKSTFKTNYPLANLELLIGSDASTDNTDRIIEKYTRLLPNVKFKRFGGRSQPGSCLREYLRYLHRFFIF